MLAKTHPVTETVTVVTEPGDREESFAGASETGSESIGAPVCANLVDGASGLRPSECGSHPAAEPEISKLGWGGRRGNSGGKRAGAGRKPLSKALAERRLQASVNSSAMAAQPGDRWYCARTHYRMELLTVGELVKQGYAAFLPRIERELPDRTRAVAPLFPGYLFIRFNRVMDRWRPIVSTPGIRHLFGVSPEMPIPLPPGVIEAMVAKARGDNVVLLESIPGPEQLDIGEEVRIIAGPFADFRGLCRLSSGNRVRLLVEMMGRQLEIEVSRAMVERVDFEPAIETA